MELRFHIDPETGQPHIYAHGVTEAEVREVLQRRDDDFGGSRKSRIRFGRTRGGRYLKVIYVPDEAGDSAFIITAYELKNKTKRAFRRRRRRKGK
jgi:hypothetical protein